MTKIAFFEVDDWEVDSFCSALEGYETVCKKEALNEKTIVDVTDATVLSVFIYSTLTKEILAQFPNLKLITTRSTGFDHIDVSYCKEKGITVCNVPSYGAHTVAEHTFTLMLALSRKLIPAVMRTKRGDFSQQGLTGVDLYGKTLGVVGAGNIGKNVIQTALGFGMKVLVFTRHPENTTEPSVQYTDNLENLLCSSDIVTLHVPYTKETHHIINIENIKQFKKGSVLINTARGPLVETQAILDGLEQGILSGVGLDVLEEECGFREERELLTTEFLKTCDLKTQLMNHVLLDRDDVIVTPHNAFNSREALEQIVHTTIENIKQFFDQKPQNLVEA